MKITNIEMNKTKVLETQKSLSALFQQNDKSIQDKNKIYEEGIKRNTFLLYNIEKQILKRQKSPLSTKV